MENLTGSFSSFCFEVASIIELRSHLLLGSLTNFLGDTVSLTFEARVTDGVPCTPYIYVIPGDLNFGSLAYKSSTI